ncbi:MAG: NapC/NirT family cytochrome c [Gemmatimonadota bacterium]|jgi:nitrate/TMAO reductase-like tetraheme cytochrome c subunit
MNFGSLLSGITGRVRALPTGAKVVIGVAVTAVVGVASVMMYQAYDYVQHDNQFCLECHLMEDPFEAFAQSAHRGLGCKACHRPNIIERSEMGLAQIVVNPDSIRVHAHVPNQICAECHIEGDPEEWRMVANTAGHRIHLESNDPSLQGLNCVECHSSGVHQFTPTDQTCGQGGCHESTTIQLGNMADLTIHCATCHDFARPVAAEVQDTAVATSLRPEATECLGCHEMRSMLADFPEDEPHDAECGACHNPHEQTTPEQAVQSCATGGCHDSPAEATPYHRGLDPGVLNACTNCHQAHDFRIHVEGQDDCLECHTDIYDDAPGTGRISGIRRPADHPPIGAIGDGAAPGPVQLASAGPPPAELVRLALAAHAEPDAPAQQSARDTVAFWHSQHRGVECTACHSTEQSHGGLTVTSLMDCRSCHHTQPAASNCQTCHAGGEVRRVNATVRRTLDIRIGSLDRPTRELPFSHEVHQRLDCARCHTDGLTLSAEAVSCDACHEEHHEPDAECMACHERPASDAHDLQVHIGCAGSGCHEAVPSTVAQVPRTRDFCLVCHQDLTDHRPGRNCEDCHTLPQPRAAQAGLAPGPHPAEP